jgi:hypothetical protein
MEHVVWGRAGGGRCEEGVMQGREEGVGWGWGGKGRRVEEGVSKEHAVKQGQSKACVWDGGGGPEQYKARNMTMTNMQGIGKHHNSRSQPTRTRHTIHTTHPSQTAAAPAPTKRYMIYTGDILLEPAQEEFIW